mgnify:FL=1
MMDNWIKINSASDETRDAIDSVAEVLKDMGIDLVYDDEQATKDNVDLFIRLNHNRGLLGVGHDVLYKLGISTDLAPYYDSIKGDGAWEKLSREQQYNIADAAESGLDLSESIDVAFSEAIQEEGEVN